ncbi:MAG: Rad52/Rad22 family DNA repair protein [Devosia marina]|uniref:Rad52/Rad22 family DNA repair protein n=1 Tax=Devosia marina TaxID=2683198 RepID=UPI0032EF82B6
MPVDLMTALAAPFPPNEIEWRVGSTKQDKSAGLALAYLTARHVMDRLDETVGPTNWQDRYEFHGSRTVCYLSIRIDGEWITKADGAGDSDVEAEKGAISDALKRAAVKFGIGRYLYDLGNTWVDIEPAGRSFRIKNDQYHKLEKALRALDNDGLVPERAPRVRTVAEEKKRYEEMQAEMHQISADGSAALKRWVNDASVLADINSLERYSSQLKTEFKEILSLAVTAEKDAPDPNAQFDRMERAAAE